MEETLLEVEEKVEEDEQTPEPEETPEEGIKEPEEKHEPPKDDKRWGEVYKKMKNSERETADIKLQLKEKDQQIADISKHHKDFRESLDRIEGNEFDDSKKPDIELDPEGFADFMFKKGQYEATKEKRDTKPENESKQAGNGFDVEEKTMRTIHADYDSVLVNAGVNSDIDKDSVLRNEIYSAPNPPRAAYDYGVEKLKRANQKKESLKDQGFVEGGSMPRGGDLKALTAGEKKSADNLGISHKEFLEEKIAIAKEKGDK